MTNKITRTHFGVYGYIEKDNKVLVINKKRGPYTGLYDLPGGSPEEGEKPEETLAREIKEETNCDLISFDSKKEVETYYSDFIEDNREQGCLHHKAIIFNATVSGTPDINISDLDSNGALWVNKNKLIKENSTPFVLMCAK